MLLRECRTGLRRYAGAQHGDQYGKTLAHYGEGDHSDPDPWQRTLGDLVSPHRTGSMTALVNGVTREIRADAADWRVDRLLAMVRQINAEGPRPEL